MILGIGTDTIEIARVALVIEKHGTRFTSRIFTPQEAAYCSQFQDAAARFAARFAAKEAVAKALGTGFTSSLTFLDIEVVHTPQGKPIIQLSSKAKEHFDNPKLHLSMSHSKEHAVAFVICEDK